QEWVTGHRGKPVEAGNLNNGGPVSVWQEGHNQFLVNAIFFPQLSLIPIAEMSLNMLIPTHFQPIDQVTLDGQPFTGDPLEVRGQRATCRVTDHEMVYEVEWSAARLVTFRLWKWAKFIRFA